MPTRSPLKTIPFLKPLIPCHKIDRAEGGTLRMPSRTTPVSMNTSAQRPLRKHGGHQGGKRLQGHRQCHRAGAEIGDPRRGDRGRGGQEEVNVCMGVSYRLPTIDEANRAHDELVEAEQEQHTAERRGQTLRLERQQQAESVRRGDSDRSRGGAQMRPPPSSAGRRWPDGK